MSSRTLVSAVRSLVTAAVGTVMISSTLLFAGSAAAKQNVDSLPAGAKVQLPDGSKVTVSPLGIATIVSKNGAVTLRRLSLLNKTRNTSLEGALDKKHLAAEITEGTKEPYAPGQLIVVFRPGLNTVQNSFTISAKKLSSMHAAKTSLGSAPPTYTNDSATNKLLGTLGVDRGEQLFQKTRVNVQPGHLNLANAYRLHVTNASVMKAAEKLRHSSSVVYASPDWLVSAMHSEPLPIPHDITEAAKLIKPNASKSGLLNGTAATPGSPASLPSNFMLTTSGQSMLNAPSNNVAAAYDEIQKKFHQLPGQGEIITNVSLGDLAYNGPRCQGETTTHFIAGQMYIDWPSMPLIAAYTADSSGNLSGSTEECGQDYTLTEAGLDFSMMAPLPHDRQRTGEVGSGLTDLLGVAPGATYRLVVPQTGNPAFSDLLAAMLGAAAQSPRPNIITASLGFGTDVFGFPSRYLEDDPLAESVVASIVKNYQIVVSISSNDGTRTFDHTSIGPSGGSTPTEVARPGTNPTNFNDLAFSTEPSRDFDSGAIAVGGTTLDDIFAAPPQNPHFARLKAQHAFPETRWDGFRIFSSGFGSRVNVSAPSDNVVAMSWCGCTTGRYDDIQLFLEGGTSASAPEAAAAAAVAMQVARLTGHPFPDPVAVRSFLEHTGTAVPGTSQSDVYNHVGPQINLTNIVETLERNAGQQITPAIARVAIEQRRDHGLLDGVFLTHTDPTNIDLQGPLSDVDGSKTDRNQRAWITIAPDWEGLPQNAEFRLNVVGRYASPLATTRWARLLPEQILRAAGLPLASSSSRIVNLRYRAFVGMHHLLAERIFSLTFGPASSTTEAVLAPIVPSVVSGRTIPVTYDLSGARGFDSPQLVVSRAGRFDPSTACCGSYWQNVALILPLAARSGTVNVSVDKLDGGGIYGIGIVNRTPHLLPPFGSSFPTYSDFAFVRIAGRSVVRPPAPLLSVAGGQSQHFLELPFGAPFRVSWNVTNVPGATGALLEFSAAGPNFTVSFNPFNNPNGTERDQNGADSGSAYSVAVPASGELSLTTTRAHLLPTFNHVVRVIPLANGNPIGEAGDVSSIQVDGVVPIFGANLSYNGFAINPDNDRAYLLSAGFTPTGLLSTLEIFSQNTGQIVQVPATTTNFWTTPNEGGATVYKPEVGLFQAYTRSGVQYQMVDLATGATNPWTPPSPAVVNFPPLLQAQNDRIHDGAFLAGFNGDQSHTRVFTSNVARNTFGPVYDVSTALSCRSRDPQGNCSPAYRYNGFDENSKTNMGVLAAGVPDLGPGIQSQIVELNLNNGKMSSFYLGNKTDDVTVPQGLAVDSGTNRAATAFPNGTLAFIDLARKTSRIVDAPGAADLQPCCRSSWNKGNLAVSFPAVDQRRHQFLFEQGIPRDFLTNANALSHLLVYDENGNLLENREVLYIFNAPYFTSAANLQLNPQRRNGYTFSRAGEQLEPFSY